MKSLRTLLRAHVISSALKARPMSMPRAVSTGIVLPMDEFSFMGGACGATTGGGRDAAIVCVGEARLVLLVLDRGSSICDISRKSPRLDSCCCCCCWRAAIVTGVRLPPPPPWLGRMWLVLATSLNNSASAPPCSSPPPPSRCCCRLVAASL